MLLDEFVLKLGIFFALLIKKTLNLHITKKLIQNGMDSLASIFSTRMKKSSLVGQIKSGLVVEFAGEQIQNLWGKKGKELARAVSVNKQILKLEAKNSIIAQELNFKKNDIISQINMKFGPNTVKRVNIVQTSIERPVY